MPRDQWRKENHRVAYGPVRPIGGAGDPDGTEADRDASKLSRGGQPRAKPERRQLVQRDGNGEAGSSSRNSEKLRGSKQKPGQAVSLTARGSSGKSVVRNIADRLKHMSWAKLQRERQRQQQADRPASAKGTADKPQSRKRSKG